MRFPKPLPFHLKIPEERIKGLPDSVEVDHPILHIPASELRPSAKDARHMCGSRRSEAQETHELFLAQAPLAGELQKELAWTRSSRTEECENGCARIRSGVSRRGHSPVRPGSRAARWSCRERRHGRWLPNSANNPKQRTTRPQGHHRRQEEEKRSGEPARQPSLGALRHLGKRNEKHLAAWPPPTVRTSFEPSAAGAARTPCTDFDLEDVSGCQPIDLPDKRFAREAPSTVAAGRGHSPRDSLRTRSGAAFTRSETAAPAVSSRSRLAVPEATAAAAPTAVAAARNVDLLADREPCGLTTAATTAAAAVEIETLHTEGPASTTATTARTRDDRQAAARQPRPLVRAGLRDPHEGSLRQTLTLSHAAHERTLEHTCSTVNASTGWNRQPVVDRRDSESLN